MGNKYGINPDGSVYQFTDLLEWAKWFETADRTIEHSTTTSPDGKVEAYVSTVFLGLDYAFGGDIPILFETMVFCSSDEKIDQEQDRYSNIQDAKMGHAKMFVKVRSYLKKKYPKGVTHE